VSVLTAKQVRAYVLETLAGPLAEKGVDPATIGDDYNLLAGGIIDSFGLLELIADVNDHFGVEIDFEDLDPEGLTVLGTFSAYVAQAAGQAPA
jgi:acyl carrier protein